MELTEYYGKLTKDKKMSKNSWTNCRGRSRISGGNCGNVMLKIYNNNEYISIENDVFFKVNECLNCRSCQRDTGTISSGH